MSVLNPKLWRVAARFLFLTFFCFGLCHPSLAQPSASSISPRAFGSKSWRENGLAPSSLPLTGNLLWDVRLANNGQLYYWSGEEWVPITSTSGEVFHNHQADIIDIFDDGDYYTGVTVESALQENGSTLAGIGIDISVLQTSIDSIVSDPRWTDARTPLSHNHTSTQVTSSTVSRCARFDGTGVLIAATGDCPSGDTTGGGGGGTPGGSGTE